MNRLRNGHVFTRFMLILIHTSVNAGGGEVFPWGGGTRDRWGFGGE